MAASEKPAAFAARSSGSSSSGAAAIVLAISLMFSSCSTNHGSTPVASATASGVAPARSAWSMVFRRPSCGVRQRSSSSSAWASTLSVNRNGPVWLSRLRWAFCSASAKERPIAIASPTDFMWVVSVGSAPGNFSNANLGILTTT